MKRCSVLFSFLSPRVHPRWRLFLLLVCLLIPAAGDSFLTEGGAVCSLPAEFGEVVYTCNEASPKQLYIVGIRHADTLTGGPPGTRGVEAEVYEIGKWLVENRGVGLVLPEGFLEESLRRPKDSRPPESSSADGGPVHAESLLRRDLHVLLRQVEDERLYQEVHSGIQRLSTCNDGLEERFIIRCELDYHQQRRAGSMLQRVPDILEEEFQGGRIRERKALLTIGLSHLSRMIDHFSGGRVYIPPPLFTSVKYEGVTEELQLTRHDFGVTVIVPRSLARDPEIIKKTGMGEKLEKARMKRARGLPPRPAVG